MEWWLEYILKDIIKGMVKYKIRIILLYIDIFKVI